MVQWNNSWLNTTTINGTHLELNFVHMGYVALSTTVFWFIVLILSCYVLYRYGFIGEKWRHRRINTKPLPTPIIFLRTKKNSYGWHCGRFRRWYRPKIEEYTYTRPSTGTIPKRSNGRSRKPIKSVPFGCPLAPTFDHLPLQPFIPTTLKIDPDFMNDDFIRDGKVPLVPSTFNPNQPAILQLNNTENQVPIMPGAVYIPPFREQSSHFWDQNVRFSTFVDDSFNGETQL